MLRREDLHRPVIIRTVIGVPVVAGVARAALGQGHDRRRRPAGRVEAKQASVGVFRVGRAEPSVAGDAGVPGRKVRDPPHGPGIDVDPDHALGPDDGDDLVAAVDGPAGHPHLVDHPFLPGRIPVVREPVAAPVAADDVDPIGVAATEAEQVGIVRVELRMTDRIVLAGHRHASRRGVDHVQPGDIAMGRAVLHRHRPPAAVGGERRRAHRVAHHPRGDHRHVPEVGQALLAEAALRRHPPGTAAGREIDVPAVIRRMHAPFVEVIAIRELQEPARFTLFEKNLRPAGAMRHEHEPGHRVVVGRQIVERMMVDRGVGSHLPHRDPGGAVDIRDRLGRKNASLHADPRACCELKQWPPGCRAVAARGGPRKRRGRSGRSARVPRGPRE